jgi:hypothetical protein
LVAERDQDRPGDDDTTLQVREHQVHGGVVRSRVSSAPGIPSLRLPITTSAQVITWVEQGYKQVKDELDWAGFQVRRPASSGHSPKCDYMLDFIMLLAESQTIR